MYCRRLASTFARSLPPPQPANSTTASPEPPRAAPASRSQPPGKRVDYQLRTAPEGEITAQASEGSITAWIMWAWVIAVFWLVFAALQVRWWAKGYDHFMRPVYTWALTALVVLGLLGLPLVLLLWPRVRRWLLLQLKPFNPPPSDSDEGGRTPGVPSRSPSA
jgi:hypothetical protein